MEAKQGKWLRETSDPFIIRSEGGNRVAQVYTQAPLNNQRDISKGESAARLIASAPEMYGMLERVQSAIDFEGGADELVKEIRTLLTRINGKDKL